jgi:lipopolysaccharide biosynthesis regulator YciM
MTNPIDVTAVTRASMLRMGQTWQSLGKLNQAEDTYFRIIEEHPGTKEAESAQRDLLAIAAGYEAEGLFHLAIGILDRLGQAADESV